jgi:hypothetical protein
MGARIDQFCENLRVKLTSIDNNMKALKVKIDTNAKAAEQDVRQQLGIVKNRLEQDRARVTTAQAEIKNWVEVGKAATNEKIAEWKVKREQTKLQSHAEHAESHAAAAAAVALAAVDEAQQAALEAWLARWDADSALGTKTA